MPDAATALEPFPAGPVENYGFRRGPRTCLVVREPPAENQRPRAGLSLARCNQPRPGFLKFFMDFAISFHFAFSASLAC